jgi:glycosyltransferase involved in cell wall biosynthesis
MWRTASRVIGERLANRGTPEGGRLPLAALRSQLDASSEGAQWSMHIDGVLGRSLLMPTGATLTYPLVLSGDVAFTARAMLLPHDWGSGRGAVRAVVAVRDAIGGRHELWSGLIRSADRRGRPRGLLVSCRLPAWSASLQLNLETDGELRPLSVARAIWLEPALIDPDAPPAPTLNPAPPPTPAPGPGPLISVLTPVHDPPPAMLEEAIASVQAQTYPHWELCLVDDGSTNPAITAALQRHAAADPRIHLTRHHHAHGISGATNAALDLATGDYIALLDHDDTLTPDALQHVADQIAAQPDVDMIYSDEDVVGETGLIERHPKPGWSPEHMDALMYTCHLGVYRRSLAVEVGGFQSRFDGCQDYDFVLRLVEHTDRVVHIPRILYHWRAHATSTAGGDQAKPYAYLAQPGAISEHLERAGIDAEVQFAHHPGLHRVVHRVPKSITVDILLALETAEGLAEAALSWLTQLHRNWNIVIAAREPILATATTALTGAGVSESRITTIPTDQDRTTALATAADHAAAEHLLFMATPAIGLTHDWLIRLLGYSHQPGIAAAGPILLSPDGRIHEAGIAVPDGVALYLRYGLPAAGAVPVVMNVAAVSGIMATSRRTYEQTGGLNPVHRDLVFADYCLRAGEQHQRTVLVPDARLRLTGPDPTTNDLPAIWQFRCIWSQHPDPYYNANYRTDRGDSILPPVA